MKTFNCVNNYKVNNEQMPVMFGYKNLKNND